jgi:hypothetical protein
VSAKKQDKDFDYPALEADTIQHLLKGGPLGGKEGILVVRQY